MLKKFDPIAAFNKDVIIQYFRDGLHFSIWAQIDERRRDLDMSDKTIEKAINAEVKAS